MNRPQQDFTFINVTEGKKQNTRTIKHHVSTQTNRRKRQEAVKKYQESLLQSTEVTSPFDVVPSSANHGRDNKPTSTAAVSQRSLSLSDASTISTTDHDENYQRSSVRKPLVIRQAVQTKDYWPTYQRWAHRHLMPPPSPLPSGASESEDEKKPRKQWKVSPSSGQSHVWVSVSQQYITVHIPRISSPVDQTRMEWGSRLCSDFVRGMYESNWKSTWQSHQWFGGHLLPLGVWRECFPLAVEFIHAGKYQQAFFLLNAAFNVTPAFFRQNNPGLLIACLGAMMWISQIPDEKLSTLIRSHITQLSMAHLGRMHPISMILKEQMRAAEVAHGRADLLSIVVLDSFSEVFGPTHFVPLSMRWGYVRRQYSSGDYVAAEKALTSLEKTWTSETTPASQIPKLLAFEKAKVRNAQQKARNNDARSLLDLGKVAEMSIELPIFVPGHGPALAQTDSQILKTIGKHLLLGSHFALALFIFTRASLVLAPGEGEIPVTPNQDPEDLPLTVARILVEHLRSEQKEEPKSGDE